MNRFIKRVIHVGLRQKNRVVWRLNRLWFRCFETFSLTSCHLGARCCFQVPVRVGGGQGTLTIGMQNSFGFAPATRLGRGTILLQPRSPGARIVIGNGNAFSNNVTVAANESVSIGDDCLIGDLVAIMDCDFHETSPATRRRSHGQTAPVILGNNVWLGSRVVVCKGVTIGENSVVAVGSVVTKSVPPNTLVGGVPAKVIRVI